MPDSAALLLFSNLCSRVSLAYSGFCYPVQRSGTLVPLIHTWIHESYEFMYETIICIRGLHGYEFISMNSCKPRIHMNMNSYLWIHIHVNSYMKWSYELIVYDMNSVLKIKKNSVVWIIDMNMNSYLWIHIHVNSYMKWSYELIVYDMNSVLKIKKNSVVWIRNIEFSSHSWIPKITTQISVINSFMNWIFMNWCTWIHWRIYGCAWWALGTAIVMQRSFILAPLLLLPLQDQWVKYILK